MNRAWTTPDACLDCWDHQRFQDLLALGDAPGAPAGAQCLAAFASFRLDAPLHGMKLLFELFGQRLTPQPREENAALASVLAELAAFQLEKHYGVLSVGDFEVLAGMGRVAGSKRFARPPQGKGWPLGKGDFYIPASPRVLQIEPTNQCNLSCPMCPRRKMARAKGFLDPVSLDGFLPSWEGRSRRLELAIPGVDRVFTDGYRGAAKLFFLGEPLLCQQLDVLVGTLARHGVSVGVQTNGALLARPEIRARLLDAAPEAVGISLDGVDAASYAAVRKGASWEACAAGVVALSKERGARGLSGRVRLTATTIAPDGSEASRERAEAFLAPLRPWLDGVNVIILNRLHAPEFLDDGGGLRAYAPTGGGAVVRLCEEFFYKLNVLWDGTVTPCCADIDGAMRLGDASEGIDNVWNNERAARLRRSLARREVSAYPLCARCLTQ